MSDGRAPASVWLAAAAEYRRTLRADRADGDAWLGLGRALGRLGRVEEAIRALRRAVACAPAVGDKRYALAQLLAGQGDWRGAAQRFREAAALDPGYWPAHFNLGICCEQMGDLAQAESAIAVAILFEPDHWEAQITLGKLRQALGRWVEAEAPLAAAIRLKPEDWNGHFALGFSCGHAMGWRRHGRRLANAVLCTARDGEGLAVEFAEASRSADDGNAVDGACGILIPFKKDMPERIENIETVLAHLGRTMPGAAIHIREIGAARHVPEHPGLDYRRDEPADGRFVRVRLLNRMAREAATSAIVLYDADALVAPEQMRTAVALARDGAADLVFPFDGRCIDLDRAVIPAIKAGLPIVEWRRHWHSIRPFNIGLACVWNRASYIAAGMENEAFEKWGQEDAERLQRALKLGMRVARVEGPIYHLNHPRRGGPPDPAVARAKEAAFARLQSMSPEALRAHVAAWPWVRRATGS
jgi:Flp pilus assembly protein TadD